MSTTDQTVVRLEPEALEPEALEPEALEPEALEPEALEPEALGARARPGLGRSADHVLCLGVPVVSSINRSWLVVRTRVRHG